MEWLLAAMVVTALSAILWYINYSGSVSLALFRRSRKIAAKSGIISPPEPVRSFVYLSDLKVNERFAQLPESTRLKANLDVEITQAPLKLRASIVDDQTLTNYSKLRVILRNLDDDELGTAKTPKQLFRDSMLMKMTLHPSTRGGPLDTVFFIGKLDGELNYNYYVALGGSRHHLRGEAVESVASSSAIIGLVRTLALHSAEKPGGAKRDLPSAWYAEVQEIYDKDPSPPQMVEFVAEKFTTTSEWAHETWGGVPDPAGVLGSPIYVALASAHNA